MHRAQRDPRGYARCQLGLLPDLFVLATLCLDLYPCLRLRIDARRDRCQRSGYGHYLLSHRNRRQQGYLGPVSLIGLL